MSNMDFITVAEAAKILGVTVSRVHQYMQEPCPDCGRILYESKGKERTITFEYGEGCEQCHRQGVRLPHYGKWGAEHKYGWKLKREDVEKLAVSRKPGYPKGRKRRGRW